MGKEGSQTIFYTGVGQQLSSNLNSLHAISGHSMHLVKKKKYWWGKTNKASR